MFECPSVESSMVCGFPLRELFHFPFFLNLSSPKSAKVIRGFQSFVGCLDSCSGLQENFVVLDFAHPRLVPIFVNVSPPLPKGKLTKVN